MFLIVNIIIAVLLGILIIIILPSFAKDEIINSQNKNRSMIKFFLSKNFIFLVIFFPFACAFFHAAINYFFKIILNWFDIKYVFIGLSPLPLLVIWYYFAVGLVTILYTLINHINRN